MVQCYHVSIDHVWKNTKVMPLPSTSRELKKEHELVTRFDPFIRSNSTPTEGMLKGCILVKAKINGLFFVGDIHTSPPPMPLDTGFGYITSKTSNSLSEKIEPSQKGQGILQTVSFQMFLCGFKAGRYDLILE